MRDIQTAFAYIGGIGKRAGWGGLICLCYEYTNNYY
ncbi:Uncharacterised protein [Bergeriella denitrificans]|uniref:Uncharacterized protein n=1 Tax=Bergeriella denitrificans TaxID=494 RepID=A0A378UGP6_BERDE|nr:Uncharacterised protein [Bergeriella denitrificans]